ncbi:type II secretion system protein [Homoserinibacter sp. GY 40078]|nr:type II secretion system protein [Homoserinibacter sp. GY 40078]
MELGVHDHRRTLRRARRGRHGWLPRGGSLGVGRRHGGNDRPRGGRVAGTRCDDPGRHRLDIRRHGHRARQQPRSQSVRDRRERRDRNSRRSADLRGRHDVPLRPRVLEHLDLESRSGAPVRQLAPLLRRIVRIDLELVLCLQHRSAYQRGHKRNGERQHRHPRPQGCPVSELVRVLRNGRMRDDAGITLVEALVVMVLSTLLMSITVTFFVNVSQHTIRAEGLRRSTADASNIMNVVSTSIRAAVRNAVATSPNPDPAIVAGSTTSVTVITYTDAGPSFETPLRLRYRVDGEGRMIEDQWQASVVNGYAVFPSMTTAPNSTRVLGNVVVNTSGEPLFRYYSVTGSQLGTGGTLSSSERAAVTTVRFNVRVRASNSHEVVVLDNTIGMPNMNLGLTGGE